MGMWPWWEPSTYPGVGGGSWMFWGDLTEGGGDPSLLTLTLGGGWRKGGPHRRLRVVESRRVAE